MKKISEDFFKGRQSIEYKGIYKHNNEKIRVYIDVDSYDFQSSANVYVYNSEEKKWNHLDGIHYSLMESKTINVYGSIENAKYLMQKDIKTLLNKVKVILE